MQAKSAFYQGKSLVRVIAMMMMAVLSLFSHSLAGDFKPDEVVCRMEPGFSVDLVNNAYGTTVKGFVQQTGCYLLATQQGQDAESLAVVINNLEAVQYCGANYYLDAPESSQRSQPFLDCDGSGDYATQLAAIELDLTTVLTLADGDGVKVAIIDGGVNFDHPEFVSRSGGVHSGWDFVDNDELANDEPGGSSSGHGTFVAGIVRLVAPGCDIYAYRVLDTLGRGDGYAVTEALLRAIQDGCTVVNLSLGMIGRHDALDDALKYAESRGVTVVTSAGNDSTEADILFPFPGHKASCITVAALDSLNIKADFSNYGPKVDICAPGTRVYSTFLDTSYAWWDGTSFAAPFVTGLSALIRSIDPVADNDVVSYVINQTAINIDSLNPGMEGKLGSGLANMVAALNLVSRFPRGDLDDDGFITALDLAALVDVLFAGAPILAPAPERADLNCDGFPDALDLAIIIDHLFAGRPEPTCP